MIRGIMILAMALLVSGCQVGFQEMGETEYGVRFRRLPTALGGGLGKKALTPGSTAFVWPWDKIYRFDTSVKDIAWGAAGSGTDTERADYIHTRALDGNEVALAVTVRYKITTDNDKLIKLAQRVATTNQHVSDIVGTILRADIRTYMNELETAEFLAKESRYTAVENGQKSISSRLDDYGVEIVRVNLDDFRFERLLVDGKVDRSYQEKLEDIQKIREDTERERSRIETVKAKKRQEFNNTQADVNRIVAAADGYKQQAILRGDAYFEARSNRAKGILAQGTAEVEGLIEQINALSGPGGRALLKLSLAKALLANDPRFVLMGDKGRSEGIDVNRVDTNDLLNQIGVFEGLEMKTKPAPLKESTKQSVKKENKQ